MNTCKQCGAPAKKRGLCHKHYMRLWRYGRLDNLAKQDPAIRFWSKVDKTKTCWNWTASTSGYGYGQFKLEGKMLKAHRYAYELLKGPIPEGLTIDHLCRNIICVNPDHMEVVSHSENTKRARKLRPLKTHCVNGHPYDEANTYYYKNSRTRGCRACGAASAKKRRNKLIPNGN